MKAGIADFLWALSHMNLVEVYGNCEENFIILLTNLMENERALL